MYGLAVNLIVSVSGHPWIINEMRNLQEQVKKAFCYQKLFRPFTVWTNFSSDLKKFSRSLEQFILTVGQNNFGNKIPFCNEEDIHF